MAHIVYGGRNYPLENERYAETHLALKRVFEDDGALVLGVTGYEGEQIFLYVSRGTQIMLSERDLDEMGL